MGRRVSGALLAYKQICVEKETKQPPVVVLLSRVGSPQEGPEAGPSGRVPGAGIVSQEMTAPCVSWPLKALQADKMRRRKTVIQVILPCVGRG